MLDSLKQVINCFMKGGASVRYHLVAKVLVLLRKSNGVMGGSEAIGLQKCEFYYKKSDGFMKEEPR